MFRVIHFELPVDDPERAKEFYEKIFGWKVEKWEGPMDYWLVMTGNEKEPGIDGGFSKKSDYLKTTTNTIEVPSFDEYAAKIKENGGQQLSDKQHIEGVGYMAYFKDTENNIFGIMENLQKIG